MHSFFGRVTRFVLWSVFGLIIIVFIVGFARFKFDGVAYFEYLNTITLDQIFSGSGNLETVVLVETGNDLSGDDLDMYDPQFQADLEALSGSLDATGSFGFVDPYATGNAIVSVSGAKSTVSSTGEQQLTGDSRKQLLNLIKSREK